MGQGGPQGQNSTLGGNPTRGNFDPAATGLAQRAAQAGFAPPPPASPGGKGGSPGGPASAPSFSSTPAARAGVTRTPAPTYSASAPPASPGGKGGSPGGPASAPSFSSAPAPSPYAAALQAAIGGYMPRSPGGAPPPMAPPPMAPPPMASPQPPRAEAVSNFDARNASIQKVRDDQAAQRGLAGIYNNMNGYYP